MKTVLKHFLFGLIVCFFYFSLPAQQTNGSASITNRIDSLFTLLKQDKVDTSKVNTLNSLANELSRSNPDTAILISMQALQLGDKIKWQLGIGKTQHFLGWFSFLKGDYAFSLEHYSKALAIFDELEKSPQLPEDKSQLLILKSKTIGNIGIVYYYQGDFPKALDYYFKALKMAEEIGSKSNINAVLNNIGAIYQDQRDYSNALDYFLKALKIAEEISDKNRIAKHLGNIGIIYFYKGDYSNALVYYFKALKMKQENGDKQGEANTLCNIGNLYMEQGDTAIAKGNKAFALSDNYPKALDYNLKALKIDLAISFCPLGEVRYFSSAAFDKKPVSISMLGMEVL